MPLVTVFTPAYNRADKLHRVFDSLLQQSFRDFEWIIIDDGSADNTREVVEAFIKKQVFFPVSYHFQPNSGKHIAINKAVSLARGKWFYIADSDDAIVPETLQVFIREWDKIPAAEQAGFCSIVACCKNQQGQRISDPLPMEPYDGNWRELFYRYGFRKEATNICLTAAMKEFPFPESVKGIYYPEAIIWRRMSDKYKIRLISDELRIYFIEYASDSIMSKKKSYRAKALSASIETADVLNNDLGYFFKFPVYFIKSALIYGLYRPFLHKTHKELTALQKNAIIFTAPFLLAGWVLNPVLKLKDKQQGA